MPDNTDISADSTLKNVGYLDHNNGAVQAYEKLKADYDSYSKQHSTADTQTYWSTVTKGLVESNTLQDISIGWASEEGEKYGEDDGSLTKRDLHAVQTSNSKNSPTDLDVSMAQAILDKYDDLRNMHQDLVGGWAGIGASEAKAITTDDIKSYLTRNDEASKQNGAVNMMAPLFAGGPPLFKVLDTAGSIDADNKITKQDLQKYLTDYDQNTDAGASPQADGKEYSQKNHDFVKKLLDEWDGPTGNILRSGDGEINLRTLGKAVGITDIHDTDFNDFAEKFASKHDSLKNDAAPDAAEKTTQSTQPTQLTQPTQSDTPPTNQPNANQSDAASQM